MSEAVQTLAPRRMTAEQAAWRSSLLGVHRTLAFSWDGEPATLSFGDREIDPPSESAIHLRIGEATFAATLSDWTGLAAARRLLGEAQVDLLPKDLQIAVAEAAFAELLDAVAACLGVECTVVGVGRHELESATTVPFTLQVEERRWTGVVAADESSWRSLSRWFEPVEMTSVREAAKLPIEAKLRCDPIPLTTEEAESLEPGDVISLQQDDSPLSGRLIIGSQGSHRAAIDDDSLTFASFEAGVPADPPCHLIAEAAGPAMTIEAADSLESEMSFRLEERSWTLRWNGRPAGVGSLVRHGGRSFLRILEWSPSRRR